ncbi:SAM-dependent methyltransferase [Nonlabens spongiae]|uniref:SAM-dependent methyltransferase n=1 Tax=Nonlabens spongiae TaxID=331648 RepID=A0A1W6MNN5_9FLAO|nr:class I SAM-dependent methyltransferase [Nonlabens spongiae]ARN79205.1 SAM-dependent methyltransferase [Nonlabens spongiae]
MKTKKPWPTKAAMDQIYKLGLWGKNGDAFYSGEGSHDHEIIAPYIQVVKEFLNSFENKLSVCDLGCGDFNVGRHFLDQVFSYTAVDIVQDLINHNRSNFHHPKLQFKCLDIATVPLPPADCVFLRQVLQHLSNAEISAIVAKLKTYKYLILTEHLPNGEFVPNLDIISGQGTRLKRNSGVVLTEPPFELDVVEEKEILAVDLGGKMGRIVTKLFTLR